MILWISEWNYGDKLMTNIYNVNEFIASVCDTVCSVYIYIYNMYIINVIYKLWHDAIWSWT